MIAAELVNKLVSKVALYDDITAYKELFLVYHGALVKFCATITRSRETAEEVVSDVFLKLWHNRSSLMKVENFHLYIYIIARNLSINRLHKDKNKECFSLEEMAGEFKSIYLDPEQLMITAEMYRRIQAAINSLPPKCRMIFQLVKEDGLKHREVAALLDISLKTVENHMTIAFRKIGECVRFELSGT